MRRVLNQASPNSLVLPLLGPSDLRDMVGRAADTFMDPLTYITYSGSMRVELGRGGLEVGDDVSRNTKPFEELEYFYATVRSVYLQHRRADLHRGGVDVESLPVF